MTEERDILDLLNEYANLGDEIAPMERERKRIGNQIKEFIRDNALDYLRDGEHGITARIQERGKSPTYDLASAPEDAVVQAARNHLLTLDHAGLERLRKNGGAFWMNTLAKYEMPGGITEALILERD